MGRLPASLKNIRVYQNSVTIAAHQLPVYLTFIVCTQFGQV